MNWENTSNYAEWNGAISHRAAKEAAGRLIAQHVQDGDVLGVGSGSTAYLAVLAIAERVRREKLRISAVCTSPEVSLACAAHGIPVTSLFQARPDWSFDGADEVDPAHNMIKGRGGAMYMEKVIMDASPKTYILVDRSKMVEKLGGGFPVPVEFLPVALHLVERELVRIGAVDITLRLAVKKDGPVITANGNFILDVKFAGIRPALEAEIKCITGVIESGLFMGRSVELVLPAE
jgi:ribose 5-phosphate isomerase A